MLDTDTSINSDRVNLVLGTKAYPLRKVRTLSFYQEALLLVDLLLYLYKVDFMQMILMKI